MKERRQDATDGKSRDAAEGGALRLPGIAGRRALVTGGSRGIGRAIVRLLARAGASVGFTWHRAAEQAEEALREAREEAARARGRTAAAPVAPGARGRAAARAGRGTPDTDEAGSEASDAGDDAAGRPESFWTARADLSDPDRVEELFGEVDRRFGGLELLVGNAGIWNAEAVGIEELGHEAWRRMLEVNLDSVYLTCRHAARRMGSGGRMVLISSTAGQRGEPGHSHYAASKGAILSFAKSLAGELGPRGVTVNVVAPGWVDTEMSAPVLRSAAREAVLEEIPLRRVATAEDVAGPVLFLLSDLARHVTGEVLNVNGGSVLCG